MGVTLYIFTFNRFPYEFRSNTDGKSMTEIDIMESISNFQLNFPASGRKVSDDLKALLSTMLEKDPSRRPDIGEIKTLSRFLNEIPVQVHRDSLLSSSSLSSQESNASSGGLLQGFSSSSLLSMGSFNALQYGTQALPFIRKPLEAKQDSFKLAVYSTPNFGLQVNHCEIGLSPRVQD